MFAVRNMCVSGVCPMRLSTCDEGDNFASSRNDMPHQDESRRLTARVSWVDGSLKASFR